MAGRALLSCLHLPNGQRRCAIFLVLDKVMQGTNKAASHRTFRRIAPKSMELVLLSQHVARAFCGRLLGKYPQHTTYFDPALDWPQPIEHNVTLPIILEQLAFLGDTRSRRELLVFAQANPSRLPLAMGIRQPNIPVRRMASERKTKLNDALVRILRRFLTPASVSLESENMIGTYPQLLPGGGGFFIIDPKIQGSEIVCSQ